jgi:hypothetical protein
VQLELDHIFVCSSVGAPEADRLIELGLSEGTPNTHPGQGTANRRFFFDNAFLELVWVADALEAQSELVRRTGFYERWSQRAGDASPFGIGLRPAANHAGEIPFPTWEYRPPYLPDPLVIQMGANSLVVTEPLVFYLAFARRPDRYTDSAHQQPLKHAAGIRTITRVGICGVPMNAASETLRAVEAACPWLSFEQTGEPLMEIGFDGEPRGKSADLRPALPLVLRW